MTACYQIPTRQLQVHYERDLGETSKIVRKIEGAPAPSGRGDRDRPAAPGGGLRWMIRLCRLHGPGRRVPRSAPPATTGPTSPTTAAAAGALRREGD